MREPRSTRPTVVAVSLIAMIAVPLVPAAGQDSEGGSIGGSIETPAPPPAPPPAAPPPESPPGAVTPSQGRAYYFPTNTQPDGWAALRSAPGGRGERLMKVYDGTLFSVLGYERGWAHVRLVSGETGWIIGRLVGCCVYRP